MRGRRRFHHRRTRRRVREAQLYVVDILRGRSGSDVAAQGRLRRFRCLQPRKDLPNIQRLRRGLVANARSDRESRRGRLRLGTFIVIAQATVLDDLRAIVGAKPAYLPDDSPTFAVDGMNPKAIVEPRTYEEVGAVMRYASQAGLATIASGGRTKPDIGNLPARYDLALSLSRLDQIIEYEPADLTVTCQAGISVPELQRRLRVHGQKVPLDERPGKQPSADGMLATNSNGPSRHAFGELRDFTIGMRVVTADGRTTRAGGKVVKNVAGYDLDKLYIGSLGTLAIVVEATFKVLPLPAREEALVARFDELRDAVACGAALARTALRPAALEAHDLDGDATL